MFQRNVLFISLMHSKAERERFTIMSCFISSLRCIVGMTSRFYLSSCHTKNWHTLNEGYKLIALKTESVLV